MSARIRAHISLVHPVPIVIVLLATLALSYAIAPSGSMRTRFFLLVSMLGGQLVIGVVNELADLEIDRATKPRKPLVTGAVSVRGARIILIAGFVLLASGSFPLGGVAFALCLLGTSIGVGYSLWFKQSLFAWLPYVFALPLIPIWISATYGSVSYRLLTLFPLGCCAIVSVQIAQSLPDIEADRAAGIDSLTTRLGARMTLVVCWSALLISASLVIATSSGERPAAIAGGSVIAGVACHALANAVRPALGVRSAFPFAAIATLILGYGWIQS